jgi:hypothetical protein
MHPALGTGAAVQARFWHFLMLCRKMHERGILAAGKRIEEVGDAPTIAE